MALQRANMRVRSGRVLGVYRDTFLKAGEERVPSAEARETGVRQAVLRNGKTYGQELQDPEKVWQGELLNTSPHPEVGKAGGAQPQRGHMHCR